MFCEVNPVSIFSNVNNLIKNVVPDLPTPVINIFPGNCVGSADMLSQCD